MKAILQRVSQASVSVEGETIGEIGAGFMILLGVGAEDSREDVDYLVEKIINLRVFNDAENKMNLSLRDTGGAVLAISQFTLYANTRKGRRPSFIEAAPPEKAEPLYNYFVEQMTAFGIRVATGQFGAMMSVQLINEGPVTIILHSAERLKPRRK